MQTRITAGFIIKTPLLSKPKKFGLQWRFHLSSDYEKDTFSFFAEGFELPHLTRQFKNKYCFFFIIQRRYKMFSFGHGGSDRKVFSFSIFILYFFSFSVQFESAAE